MATYDILADNKPYYTVKVMFDGQEFVQTIYSENAGKDLSDQIQAYANEYEAATNELTLNIMENTK